jgi:hypothetical protein
LSESPNPAKGIESNVLGSLLSLFTTLLKLLDLYSIFKTARSVILSVSITLALNILRHAR